ncbi:MAG TPA: hypothetical protein VEA69_01120 [Tepidisphaeraceae bacterium]|nr:hypothetical protein [Tepidisphaeraceae bacterium]
MYGDRPDHGALDYWAMGFGLVIAFGVWPWFGGLPETAGEWVWRLSVLGVGGVGLGVCLWMKRKWS